MKNNVLLISVIFLATIILPSCCKKHQESISGRPSSVKTQAGPPVYIYQTRADYYQYVPVILSEDKKSLSSFPAISDLTYKGELALPTRLNGGFLLDNRGISKNAAFLSITYDEYIRLAKTPSADELMKKIMDSDPFTILYYCGSRFQYKDLENELNQMIEKKDFSGFVRLK